MIKINVFNEVDYNKMLLEQAVGEFAAKRSTKTFSGRHPELGKMRNCQVCDRRHRGFPCVPVYATVPGFNDEGDEIDIPLIADQNTMKGYHGAKNFKGRILHHRNKWGLQVIERTLKIYREDIVSFPSLLTDEIDFTDEQKEANQKERDALGKSSLSRALNELRAERAARRRKFLKFTRASRRINRAA